jgi:hypothetical protein
MTADQMTPGTALVPVAPTETEQTLVVDQYFGKAIEIQDVLKRQSKYDLRKPYTEVMGRALAHAMDTSLLALAADADTQRTAISALTYAEIVDASTDLDAANVPMEDRALVVNAVGLGDLRKDNNFTEYDSTGKAGVKETQMGIRGTIFNTPVYLTNAVQKSTASGTPYQYILFHKSAFAMATQLQPNVESDRDILKKTDLVSTSALWGVRAVRTDHAVVIQRTA